MEVLQASVVNTQDQAMIATNRMTMPLIQTLGDIDDIDIVQSDSGIILPALPRGVMNFTILLAHALLNIYSAVQ